MQANDPASGHISIPPSTHIRSVGIAGLCSFALVAAVCVLFVPFLDNALVYDDGTLFATRTIFDAALVPIDLAPRTFPYFTLGVVEVFWRSIEAQRVVSLVFHLVNVLLLFFLLRRLTIQLAQLEVLSATVLAALGAAAFGLHPVAVYGAAYLVQRTIECALLFTLLSAHLQLRSVRGGGASDAVVAGLCYGMAVLSKEHALLVPAGVVAITLAANSDWRLVARRAIVYFLVAAPFAWLAFRARGQIIGTSFEPFVDGVIGQMPREIPLSTGIERWVVSAIIQCGLFFDYLRDWFLPDPNVMAIDLRVDFGARWNPVERWGGVLAYVTWMFSSLAFLHRGGRWALAGAGMLYSGVVFGSEFAAPRFQDPFVLYRSYLWAPGYTLIACALVAGPVQALVRSRTPVRALALVVVVVALAGLGWAARDRLVSLRSELAAWEDSARKLSREDLPGADQIFYNRGHEYFEARRFAEASADFERVLARHPRHAPTLVLRGQLHLVQHDPDSAERDFLSVLQIDPTQASAHYGLGRVLQQRGDLEGALAQYRIARKMGSVLADVDIHAIEDGGLKIRSASAH